MSIVRASAVLVVSAALAASGPARAEAPTPARIVIVDGAELDRLVAPLARGDREARRAAARSLEALGPDAVPAIEKKLAALRKTEGVASAVRAAREASDAADLLDALVEAKGGDDGHAAALTTAALLRALARIGTTPAVRQIVSVSVDHGGAFRPEATRLVTALGDKAVAALLETRSGRSSALRSWAYSQLEAMGKRMAGDAVQTQDNQVLADVLHAFANGRDLDAIPVLLSFVNSDRIQVREAARDAVLAYGQDASTKLREGYANLMGSKAPEDWRAPRLAKELFDGYDRLRLQEVYALIDEGLAKHKEGKVDEAVAAFDKVLARQPMIERRLEMVPAYVAYAEGLERTDPARALAVLRKAARLWPDHPRGPQIQAEIAYLEGMELLGRGVPDVASFERALALAPTHERARAELARFETKVEQREGRLRLYASGAAAALTAVVGIVLFGGYRRGRRRA